MESVSVHEAHLGWKMTSKGLVVFQGNTRFNIGMNHYCDSEKKSQWMCHFAESIQCTMKTIHLARIELATFSV